MNEQLNQVSGFIQEDELVALAGNENAIGGTGWGCVIAIITITLTAGVCPTSACTKSC